MVAGASGDARLAVKRFVHLCVEVLNGYRPAAHLRRLSLPAEAAEVASQGLAGARRVAEMRRPRRSGDRRSARPSPVAVIKVNLCEPRPGAVEAAVALVTGERTWAMALRLELHDDSWCATTLRLI
ncbi:Rv3235 family protein [Actinoplanes regularis]|uniref:Rv3235 family protein n=1 Tax=Actinoplanes regularis TaxID=52697 RepID=UPI0032D9BADE